MPERKDAESYARAARFPGQVAIETTAHCNARCPFCPLFGPGAAMTRPRGIMDMALFEKILAELDRQRQSVHTIFFNVEGEPLVDPLFTARLERVRHYALGSKIKMQTNAQFLGEQNARSILAADFGQITVGFDGATRETYERHRVNCSYERVLGNIRAFIRLRDELRGTTRVAIQYVRTPHNAHEVEPAIAMWSSILEPGRDCFFDTTSRNWATPALDRSGWVIETVESLGDARVPCPLLADSMNILYDGRVPVCCWDYNVDIVPGGIGDVRTQTLEEIWNASALAAVRQKHARLDFSELPRCAECTLTRPGKEARPATDVIAATRYGTIRRLTHAATESDWMTRLRRWAKGLLPTPKM
jgi:MoaA/NifB/PqqE/SkfB family radical SAM enzyme